MEFADKLVRQDYPIKTLDGITVWAKTRPDLYKRMMDLQGVLRVTGTDKRKEVNLFFLVCTAPFGECDGKCGLFRHSSSGGRDLPHSEFFWAGKDGITKENRTTIQSKQIKKREGRTTPTRLLKVTGGIGRRTPTRLLKVTRRRARR